MFFSMQAVMRLTLGTWSRQNFMASARQARRCSRVPAASLVVVLAAAASATSAMRADMQTGFVIFIAAPEGLARRLTAGHAHAHRIAKPDRAERLHGAPALRGELHRAALLAKKAGLSPGLWFSDATRANPG